MIKIISGRDIKLLDVITIEKEGISSLQLMERACMTFIKWFKSNFSNSNKIKIFCGSGNNGGDALLISKILIEMKYNVQVFFLNGNISSSDECIFHLNSIKKKRIVSYNINKISVNEIQDCDIIIDGLFGSGLSRKLDKSLSSLIEHINSLNAKKISIDIPSGIPMDMIIDSTCMNSDFTITFQLPKFSFYFPEYSNFIGKIITLDIGLNKEFITKSDSLAHIVEESDIKKNLFSRKKNSHKGNYGHGLIIAGSKGKMGACIMASNAALKSGIGLLSTYIPGVGEHIMQTSVPEAMTITDSFLNEITSFPDLKKYTVIGVGPGVGITLKTQKAFINFFMNVKIPIVVDADAINILSKNKKLLKFLPKDSVLTPHPKEFERLVGKYKNTIDRIILQKKLSRKYKINIIVKGAYSMMTDTDGNLFINTTGNPGMATAGSGDVLTGIITGLIGRGYKPFVAMMIGVYVHGLSGDISNNNLGEESLTATDLIKNLSKSFKMITN